MPPRRPATPPKKSSALPKSQVAKQKASRHNWLALIVLSVIALLGYVVYSGIQGRDDQPKAACVLVIDRTGSSADAKTVENYAEDAERVIDGCADRRAELEIYSFDEDASKLNLESQNHVFLGKKKGVAAAKGVVKEILQRPLEGSSGSNIVAALVEAARRVHELSRYVGQGEQFLVMLTDGYQLSEDVSVEQLTEDEESAQPLIERVGTYDIDLADTAVSMVGVLSGADQGAGTVPYPFERALERFWTGVVEGGKGRLCTYVYEPTRLPVSC